jgi:hypothetical protein
MFCFVLSFFRFNVQSAGGVVLEAVMLAGVDQMDGTPAKQPRLSTDDDIGSPDDDSAGQNSLSAAVSAAVGDGKMTGSDGNYGNQGSESDPAAGASASAVTVTTKADNESDGHASSIPIYSQQQQIFTTNADGSSYTQAGAGDANYGGQGDANANSYQNHNWQ